MQPKPEKETKTMTQYNAHYRTDAEYALYHFEADSPEQALQLAREFYEHNSHALQFDPYDGGFMPLDEVEISSHTEDQLAVWQSDAMRLRLAAPELLAALEYCERVLRDHEQYDDEEGSAESEAASMARAAIAKAKPPAP
jgi:hypothetical protein